MGAGAGSVLVLGCPGGCGRPASPTEIICVRCTAALPVEVGQRLELARAAMVEAVRAYSGVVLSAADWFEQNQLVAPRYPNPFSRHGVNDLCDCPPPIPGRPYHCAATRVLGKDGGL